MFPLPEMFRRIRSTWRRDAVERGLDEEIRFHIDQLTEKYTGAGLEPAEARRRAILRFGGVERMREHTRDEFRAAFVEDALRDLRYGARVLVRAPGFALVAILTLGLGMGAATAVFSVVNGVLLSALPYPDPDRIVRVFQIDADGRRMVNVSEPNYYDWRQRTRVFRAAAQVATVPTPVVIAGEASMTIGSTVSKEFFDVMGVRPAIGRTFTDDELHLGARPAVVISDRLWRTRFGSMPLGQMQMRIGDRVHQIVGIMPPSFEYPPDAEFWAPRELLPPDSSRTAHNWTVVGRLADGVALETAIAELSALSRALKEEHGDGTWMSDATAVPLLDQLTASARPALLMLFGASVVLLLIACLNVSNLQLARASARRREFAVRLAVGAGRGRLVRQLLAESFVLSALATLAAVLVAVAGVRALVALQPANLPRIQNVGVDATALVFAAAVAALTAVLLGVVTAHRMSRHDVREALSEGTRSLAGGRTSERVRQGLVVAQIALTIVLLAGAGLLTRSFVRLMAVDPGYVTTDALLLDAQWPFSPDATVQQRRRDVQSEVLARLAELPGVQGVGLINAHPLGGSLSPNGRFLEMTRIDELSSFEDLAMLGPEADARAGYAEFRVASEGYFRAMGIRLVRGRLFEESDGPDAPHVAVISESLAEAKWPNQDPLGRFVQFGNMDGDLRGFRIVGIVSDVREVSPERAPRPTFYGYYRQRMASSFTVVVRSPQADRLSGPAQQVMRAADPGLPIQVRRVEDAFDRALAGRRFSLSLIAVFSIVALTLATLGVYGLISYLVAERTREIGVRLALGAEPGDVLRLVLGRSVVLAAAGIALGLAVALASSRVLEGMLFGVTSTDPVAYGLVVALTLTVVVLASYVPVRRALRIAPANALRAE